MPTIKKKSKVKREDPQTWVPFRKANCPGCHALCCTLPVEVTVAELQRMELIQPDEASWSIRKIAAKLKKEGYVESSRESFGLLTLRRHPNHDCLFLDENRRCKIYSKRPQVCRKFPGQGDRPGYCPEKRAVRS